MDDIILEYISLKNHNTISDAELESVLKILSTHCIGYETDSINLIFSGLHIYSLYLKCKRNVMGASVAIKDITHNMTVSNYDFITILTFDAYIEIQVTFEDIQLINKLNILLDENQKK